MKKHEYLYHPDFGGCDFYQAACIYEKPNNFYKKSKIELCGVLAGVLALAIMTYFFAREWNHYLFGVLAILTFVALWMKQGISSKGIIRQCRGKELYLWNEISRVDIEIADNIKIKYFDISNSQIGSLNFGQKKSDLLVDILNKNVREVHRTYLTASRL